MRKQQPEYRFLRALIGRVSASTSVPAVRPLLIIDLAMLYFTGRMAIRIRISLDQCEMLLIESLVEAS